MCLLLWLSLDSKRKLAFTLTNREGSSNKCIFISIIIQDLHFLCCPWYLMPKKHILWLKTCIAINQCNNNILFQTSSHKLLIRWSNQKMIVNSCLSVFISGFFFPTFSFQRHKKKTSINCSKKFLKFPGQCCWFKAGL